MYEIILYHLNKILHICHRILTSHLENKDSNKRVMNETEQIQPTRHISFKEQNLLFFE